MLFTEGYQKQQEQLHKDKWYGIKGIQFLGPINMCIKAYNCKTLLDYGCGPFKRLEKHIEIEYTPYDIVPPFHHDPVQHDMVVACDVLL